jgi:hypothetical protein
MSSGAEVEDISKPRHKQPLDAMSEAERKAYWFIKAGP